MELKQAFGSRKPIVGVVHLAATPGAPQYEGRFERIRDRAVRDALRLTEAGCDALIVENFGDAPFYKDRVPAETVAAMAVLVSAIRDEVGVPLGVNVLRNDAESALSIAASTGAGFIRVNVLTGAVVADQGLIEGRAADLLRLRARLAPDVRILADLRVKHAQPLAPRAWEEELQDLIGRGGADAVLITGARTGAAPDPEFCSEVRTRANGTPVLLASGATADNVADFWPHVDGIIVGSATKKRGDAREIVSPDRARRFVEACRTAPQTSSRTKARTAPGTKARTSSRAPS